MVIIRKEILILVKQVVILVSIMRAMAIIDFFVLLGFGKSLVFNCEMLPFFTCDSGKGTLEQ